MASYSRTSSRHMLLPSAMTLFLKRRAAQLMGFFMVCLAIILGAMLGTYKASDPSWNFASDVPIQNLLAFPGAVVADVMFQTFGLAAGLWVVAFLVWGVRSMLTLPLKWPFFRVFLLIITIFLVAALASQWTTFQVWFSPNSLGGAFGDIIVSYYYKIFGTSWSSFLALNFIAPLGAVNLLLLSLGLSIKQITKLFLSLTKASKSAFLWFLSSLIYLFSSKTKLRNSAYTNIASQSFFSKNKLTPSKIENTDSEPSFTNSKAKTKPFLFLYNQESAQPTSLDLDIDGRGEVFSNVATDTSSYFSEDHSSSLIETHSPTVFRQSKSSNHSSSPLPNDFSINTDYELPSLDLLDPSVRKVVQTIDPVHLEESANLLKNVLEEFGVKGDVVMVRPGPVVTMYEFKPAAGIKTSRVIGLADDIARSMSALSARIAVIPGRNVIGIELPNSVRETVYLRELLQSDIYEKTTSHLPLILGKDIGGQSVIADLTRMPHLLVAGTTGSGKSVAVNTMILSLLFRLPPERCKFIMIDPKMLELSVYDGIPHLLAPVVTDSKKAVVALRWAVREMENRYRAMSKLGVRNIDGYNARVKEARMTGELLVRRVQTGFDPDSGKPIFENQPLDLEVLPYIVVVVDEMADLMMVAGKEIEAAVQRLAQMARAAGIHLIMATQRPSVDVITGTIKANFPTRISFQVTSKIDSRTILGEQGAEQLLGQGDMLYMAGGGRILRVHGPFVRDDEVERIVAFLKTQAEPVYIDGITEDEDELPGMPDASNGSDTLYNQAVELVIREGKASTSFIQRHLQIGYNKAAGIMEQMEKNGVVSSANHVGKREVLR